MVKMARKWKCYGCGLWIRVTHKSINQTSSKRKVYAIDIDSNM